MYAANPKGNPRSRTKSGQETATLVSQVASMADAVFAAGYGAFRKLVSSPDDEAALAAELAAEIAAAEKLIAEANEAEKRALAAGANAKQAIKLAAAAKRRAKAALDLQHSTESKLSATRARKRKEAAANV
ncbi:hypothetical protein A6A05_19520 [Magnetospirillum moscoviense]|uniref:Uncharacterized protein n=1 Tax=Magnetospirillum moscoviense TaxID=1437059 RepID=A0A178MYK4_9PROT|nr:hypothetical protein A6A05_19520 [Magnetospirillum moscoviense]